MRRLKRYTELVLMSLKPEFAERILSGDKRTEFRRVHCSFTKGTVLLLYCSGPVKSIVGWSVVKNVSHTTPGKLRRTAGGELGLSAAKAHAYLRGAERASRIDLGAVFRLSQPVPLGRVRSVLPGFNVPQSYRRVSTEEVKALTSLGVATGPHQNPYQC